MTKTTWEDFHKKGTVHKTYSYSRPYSEFAKSSIDIHCPFCEAVVTAYIWSLSGGGKRCDGCGAMFGTGGDAFKKEEDIGR